MARVSRLRILPMVDARLLDGSRINVAVRPIAIDGPLVSIRKFAKRPFEMQNLVQNGTLSAAMAKVSRTGTDVDPSSGRDGALQRPRSTPVALHFGTSVDDDPGMPPNGSCRNCMSGVWRPVDETSRGAEN